MLTARTARGIECLLQLSRWDDPISDLKVVHQLLFRFIAGICSPISSALVVVLGAKMGYEVFAHDVTEVVLELCQLDEEVILRIQTFGVLGTLEVEGKPLLNPTPTSAVGEVHE